MNKENSEKVEETYTMFVGNFTHKNCYWLLDEDIYAKHLHTILFMLLFFSTRLWGAADAEIKVPSVENTELEDSPFKAWGRSVYIAIHTALTARDFFLTNFYLLVYSPAFFQNLSLVFPVLAVASTGSRVGPQNKFDHPAQRYRQLLIQVPVLSARGIQIGSKTCFIVFVGLRSEVGVI